MDAATAANATLGLMEPTGNGLGGDLFAIVWDAPSQRLHGLNGSGRSPYSLTLDHFKNFKETYSPDGHAMRKGEVFKNPGLANSLEKIANGGRDAF